MYKFEISADSPAELSSLQREWAENLLKNETANTTMKPVPMVIPFRPAVENPLEQPNASAIPAQGPTIVQRDPIPAFPPVPDQITATETLARQNLVSPFVNKQLKHSVDVDSRGLPWDGRIHSDTRNTNKDGSWRNKKGVDKTLLAQVEQELLSRIKSGEIDNSGHSVYEPQVAQMAPIPAPTVPLTVPSNPPGLNQAAVGLPTFDDRNVNTPWENTIPTQAVAPVAQPAQPSYQNVQVPQGMRPAHSLNTFKANFEIVLAQLIEQGKINQKWIQDTCAYFRIKDIWNVLGSEAQLIEIFNTFVEHGFITKVG